jgi:hypothetical protein
MDVTTQYTAEEWQVVCGAPAAVTACVAQVDYGLLSSLKEAKAFGNFKHSAQLIYGQNDLIQKVLEADAEPSVPLAERENVERLLQEIGTAVTIVSAKARPQDAQEYRQFLYTIAEVTAEASGEGWLGTGTAVSTQEEGLLQRLKTLLQV